MITNPECKTCDLRKNNLFSVLRGEQIDRLDREKMTREYQRGDVIFYENTPAFAIYCIFTGWVKVYKVGSRAERQVVRLLGPGDVIGHRAVLANEPYSTTAEAIQTSLICSLPKESLFKMLEESPQLSMRLMGRLARELRVSEDQMVILSHKSVRQRAAQLLLLLMRRSPEADDKYIELKIPIRRNEMAQMIGTTPETLSRTLRYFGQRGLLQSTRTELRILDPEGLRQLAGMNADFELP
ncbi:MAG: cyclic nucleotide-binding domain-containing protein [Candidatus Latescibacteria bacterium]|nr:cyclic nucleotide-binding domain-containing protein [Candidatus Latescibacterota bacterium]NIO01264.1 cyclic nucleotide-binding domain-containing protein [Candidatus Latescibacterota bacterium]NIO27756.1 cyclic nucleotide-binding domain-containing protein [Candidatus Latescibacterota bacterium]NIO55303.1 cyclic nucleotide-binding domain-containing protein [Candidatus Latescibacterota bacterium]NIO78597.1 cyclic nucleotide-binding domain-containing protein [Candidatus Latescibacterota bacteri